MHTSPTPTTPPTAQHLAAHAVALATACYECEEAFTCIDADCADEAHRATKLCNYCFQQHQDVVW